MNLILAKLATAIGGIAFLAALIIGYANGVAIGIALCRAAIIMIATTITVIVFFRFFINILRQFVFQRVTEHNKAMRTKETERMQKPS